MRSTKQPSTLACPKPRKRGKSARQLAEAYADRWLAELVILRDKHCVTCGAPAFRNEKHGRWFASRADGIVSMDPSHVFGRGRDATRWNPENVHAQCRVCHDFYHRQDKGPLRNYALSRIGQDAMDDLWLRSKTVSHFSADTIKAFGDSFREHCQEMER